MTFNFKMNNGIGSSIIFAIRLVLLFPLLHQSCVSIMPGVAANPDAKRLYDDLLSHYNRLIRPVSNNSQVVTVGLGLHLTQLIDLDLKNQILTTNVWVEHEWIDAKLTWDPEEYGGVRELMVPSEHIWLPDIVLYNNADGEYAVTTMTKAILHSDGHVKWNPPAIFKSYCEIDVRYFPFDTQTCFMKFGSWSYSGLQMDLKHLHSPDENLVEIGMNLKDYYPSGEWDILDVPAERHAKKYDCCPDEFFADIFFNITLRRKTLFYTVNLIIPCVGISCLSVLTFYLPADSGEKVALCITTLLSQTMFFLLMSEIIPSTSLAMPLLGKYLLFTMCLVGLSVLITIVILNVRYRKPSTHKISPWVRRFFIQQLPKMLLMRIPKQTEDCASSPNTPTVEATAGISSSLMLQDNSAGHPPTAPVRMTSSSPAIRRWSRSASPFHFGSQLLCEIINYNSVQQQQQQDRYYQQQQQQQQYPLCASRLPPPPQTPSSPISIITTMPLYPPPPPPLSFLPTQLPLPPPPPSSSLTYPHITSRRSSTSEDDDSSLRSCCQASAHTSGGAFTMATGRDCVTRTVMTCPHDDDDGSGRNSLQMRRRRQEFHRPSQRIPKRFPLELQKAIRDVQFIQNHMKRADEYDEEDNDWGFIAMVLDRFFLWVFTAASLCGTISILFTAPALYDDSSPINLKYLDRLGFY